MPNIVFIVNIPDQKRPGRNLPYQYSIRSWEQYCRRHGAELFILTERVVDESAMNANWHKIFALKLLEANGIEYDKVLIVDADTIVHPNAPNIFDVCGDGFCAVANEGSYDWLFRSMEAYSKYMFNGFTFPFYQYFNSGVICVNKNHEQFFDMLFTFYTQHNQDIIHMQETFHVGTDQPVLNFMVHLYRDDFQLLPFEWNMQDLWRLEILDTNLTFTNYGWVYHFNAIPGDYKLNSNSNVSPSHQWMEYAFNKLYN